MHSFKFMKTKVFFFGEAARESQSAYGSFQNYTFRSLKCGKKATRCIPADLKMFCLLYTEDRITSLRLQLRNFHLGLHLKYVQKIFNSSTLHIRKRTWISILSWLGVAWHSFALRDIVCTFCRILALRDKKKTPTKDYDLGQTLQETLDYPQIEDSAQQIHCLLCHAGREEWISAEK